jgi:hypothetical protein
VRGQRGAELDERELGSAHANRIYHEQVQSHALTLVNHDRDRKYVRLEYADLNSETSLEHRQCHVRPPRRLPHVSEQTQARLG